MAGKKHQTDKHRKQRKKEQANKKENKQQQVVQQVTQRITDDRAKPLPAPQPEHTLSPARRAFQDV